MPLLTRCSHPQCPTLTIGPLCIEHDSSAASQLTTPKEAEAARPAIATLEASAR